MAAFQQMQHQFPEIMSVRPRDDAFLSSLGFDSRHTKRGTLVTIANGAGRK